MKPKLLLISICFALFNIAACLQNNTMNYNKLTPEEEKVIINKGTEMPFTGKYYKFKGKGTYVCKRCNAPLYKSEDKFDSDCGWPSFDEEIPGAIKRIPDPDGIRTEISCARCGAHLGHVFTGEHLTAKNTRYCVNSISMNFIPEGKNLNTNNDKEKTDAVKAEKAIFAGGCFWGVEYYMQKAKGVISSRVGYIGGHTKNPTYEEVCSHTTGYAEAVEVTFDPSKISYEELAKLFFQIHDPTQANRQGPDIGDQYRSEIFYTNDGQKAVTEKLIEILIQKGYKVTTKVEKAGTFYQAEDYHQDYYEHKGTLPYCHVFVKRF